MEPPDALRAFRRSFYECLHRRADALFELADAILTADSGAPSPAHLSLQASHRRGWGSLYAALDRGRIDDEALRKLLARHPLALGGADEAPVFAVDVSVWPRCDAECSPERGFYYHPSRHSAGQPIVAGWAYQWIAQLGFARESWTAPVDVRRVRPEEDANAVAAGQVRALLGRLGKQGAAPLFVFDAGYDPVKVQMGIERSPCQILVRLRAGRRFYGEPSLSDPPTNPGRPRRHGPKMKCNDPSTWPEPSAEHACEDAGYGSVRVRAWAELHPKVQNHEGRGSRGPLPIVVGTLVLVEVPLPQAGHGVDDAQGSPPRAGQPVELAGGGRIHAVEVGARPCRGLASAVGAPLRRGSADACTGSPGGFVTFGGTRHACQAAETLRSLTGTAQR
jgi:hypothetical protein